MRFLFGSSSLLQPNSCFKGAVKLKRGKMIVFKSMFNDVLLGEKSSSSRCLHAKDGDDLPRLPVCLRTGGDVPVSHQSRRWPWCPRHRGTDSAEGWHWEGVYPGLQVAAEGTPPACWIAARFSSDLSSDYEQVTMANVENILLVFSAGEGSQDPSP